MKSDFIFEQPYQLSFELQKEVERQVQAMLDAKIIRKSNGSPWAAPVFLVAKKNGEKRFCIDYRQLNKQTVRDSWPLPNIQDILKKVGSAKYFSLMDVRQGYFHLPIREGDKYKTAFITHSGQYELNRLGFGLMNAPPAYQRTLQTIFEGIPNVVIYIDDILIFSETLEDHLNQLQMIFARAQAHNLKLSMNKCHFFQQQVPFLGHILEHNTVSPDPTYIHKVLNVQTPKTFKQLERFLGLVQWLAKFIPNLSTYAQPLHHLKKGISYQKSVNTQTGNTRKRVNTQWVWTQKEQTAFENLKQLVQNTSYLRIPTHDKPFTLYCDASQYAIGAVLLQEDEAGNLQPCEFISRQLTDTQQQWSAVQLELYAIVHAVTTWRHYLLLRHFDLFTDHRNLTSLFELKQQTTNINRRVQRWAIVLSEYTFTCKHVPGHINSCADFLSRETDLNRAMETDDTMSSKHVIAQLEVLSNYKDIPNTQNEVLVTTRSQTRKQNNQPSQRVDYTQFYVDQPLHQTSNNNDESKQNESSNVTDPKSLIELAFDFLKPPFKYNDFTKPERIKRAQEIDNETDDIATLLVTQPHTNKYILLRNKISPSLKKLLPKMRLDTNGILCYEYRVFLPQQLRHAIINFFHTHTMATHFSAQRTFEKIKETYYWPNMEDEINDFVRACSVCQQYRIGHNPNSAPMFTFQTFRPYEIVHIDIVGPMPVATDGSTYILTIMDRFSSYVVAVPIPDKSAKTVAVNLFNNWICKHGAMQSILSDRGTEFRGEVHKYITEHFNIKHVLTTHYHPQTNGKLERWHRYLKDRLNAAVTERELDWEDNIMWPTILPSIAASYNMTATKSTKISPHELIFGDKFYLPITHQIPPLKENAHSDERNYHLTLNHMLFNLRHAAKANQALYDKKRLAKINENRVDHHFLTGDYVLRYIAQKHEGNAKKLKPRYDGPWVIDKIHETNTVLLRDPDNENNTFIENVKKLKPYHAPQLEQVLSIHISHKDFLQSLKGELQMFDQPSYRVKLKYPTHTPKTPVALAKQFAEIASQYGVKACDLFAGAGTITQHLKHTSVSAIENDIALFQQGSTNYPRINWIKADLTNPKAILSNKTLFHSFDTIVSNPPFDLGFVALRLATLLVKDSAKSTILMLLPTDYFVATTKRKQLLQLLPITITQEFRVGKWNYYAHLPNTSPKQTSDSIFIFKLYKQLNSNNKQITYNTTINLTN